MRCVQCLSSSQCAAGATRGLNGAVCNVATNRCVQCLADADCGTNQGNPYCDITRDRCVECIASTNCAMGQTCMNGRCG